MYLTDVNDNEHFFIYCGHNKAFNNIIIIRTNIINNLMLHQSNYWKQDTSIKLTESNTENEIYGEKYPYGCFMVSSIQ